jgi:hypothetical protein
MKNRTIHLEACRALESSAMELLLEEEDQDIIFGGLSRWSLRPWIFFLKYSLVIGFSFNLINEKSIV